MSKHHAFHWPDHNIGKRESRRIREEHNAFFNDYHELREIASELLAELNSAHEIHVWPEGDEGHHKPGAGDCAMCQAIKRAKAALNEK